MKLLQDQDFIDAGQSYDVDPAFLAAFSKVESGGCGFFLKEGKHKGRLKVLFEGHYFHRLTNGKFSKIRPDLSYPVWTKKYYRGGQAEMDRFIEALMLCKTDQERELCTQSASWGMFQTMGANFKVCGYDSAEEMVEAYMEGEQEQLKGVLNFCQGTLHKGLGMNLIQLMREYCISGEALYLHALVGKYNGKGQVQHYSGLLLKEYNNAKVRFK